MSSHPRILRASMAILGFLAANAYVEASVVSLKAVKKNGIALPPTNSLAVLGGDIVEAEIFLDNWANDFPPPQPGQLPGVRIYQVTMNTAGYISGSNGTVLPYGWQAPPFTRIQCLPACPPTYPVCNAQYGCTCAGHDPSLGALVAITNPVFLFLGLDPIADVGTGALNYRYFAIAPDDAVVYTGMPKYLGTLILKVSANACGTLTIDFDNDSGLTFIADAAAPPRTSLPSLQPLTLTVSDCARQLVSCVPAHCNIDARVAREPTTCAGRNTNIIDMTFSKPTVGMTAGDFEVTLVPFVDGDVTPVIQSVTPDPVNPNQTRLTFLPRIREARWTCFRHIESNRRCCLGSLPGDSDDNQITDADDVFELYDNLSGVVSPQLAMDKCDTDRSLLCTPADLLIVVDLLNDSLPCDFADFPSLPTCPSMVLPPAAECE